MRNEIVMRVRGISVGITRNLGGNVKNVRNQIGD